MNKTLLIMTLMLFSLYGFGQIYKIKYIDTLNVPYYASIYGDNAFVHQGGPTIALDTGYLYIKNGKKWHYNQMIPNVEMHGSYIGGTNHGILYKDELFVVKSNYLHNRDVLFIYNQNHSDLKFYMKDSILLDTLSSIANFAVYDDWIFIRDYWGDFSDFPNIKNINSYYFFHRENNKWIKKTKISYESDISATYISARFAMNDKYAYAGQEKKIVIFKRNGDKWMIHQNLTCDDCPHGNGTAFSNISVSSKGTWLITEKEWNHPYNMFKLINDRYVFYQEILSPLENNVPSLYFNITETELLGGFPRYKNEKGIIIMWELIDDKWGKKYEIHPPVSDTIYHKFGYSIDRYHETVITNAPGETFPDQIHRATYIFQIPARDTLTAGICEGESYTFNDSVIYDAGHYTDTLLASYGVDSVVQLYLTVYPREQIEIDTILCDDESLMVGDSLLTEEGIYTINLKNIYGCDSIVTARVEYDNLEVSDSITADYGCQNGEIKLILQGNNPPYAFKWNTGDIGEDISGLSKGEYSVTITSESGCEYDYEYQVGDSIPYLMPNAFFPSGQEEINSIFKPYTAKDVHILSTEIYDRWGEKVFSGAEDEYWDGTYKGKAMPPGVYLYRMEIDSPCGQEVKTGQVVLMR